MTATFGNSSLWTCETRSSERAAGVPIPRWNFNPGYRLQRERFVDITSAAVSKRNFPLRRIASAKSGHIRNSIPRHSLFFFYLGACGVELLGRGRSHQAVTRLQIVRKRKSCANREQTVSRDVKQRQKVPRKAAAQQTKPR